MLRVQRSSGLMIYFQSFLLFEKKEKTNQNRKPNGCFGSRSSSRRNILFVSFSQTLAVDGATPESNETAEDSESHSDGDEDEAYPALGDALTQLGLPEYVGLFESEEMDMETFVS